MSTRRRYALAVLMLALGCSKAPRRSTDEPLPQPAVPPPMKIDAAIVVAVDAPPPGDAMTAPTLGVELAVQPAKLTKATRDKLMLTLTVKNLGSQTIDPQINLSELAVDGAVAKAWNMSLANSGRPKKWKALPAGDSVSGSVAGIADDLFPKAGDYTLVLTVSGVASAPITVSVAR